VAPSCVTLAPQSIAPSIGFKLANKISGGSYVKFLLQKGLKNKKFGHAVEASNCSKAMLTVRGGISVTIDQPKESPRYEELQAKLSS
jgi:hypothetical protein